MSVSRSLSMGWKEAELMEESRVVLQVVLRVESMVEEVTAVR